MNTQKTLNILHYLGMGLVVIGVILKIAEIQAGFYIFLAGVIPVIGVRIYNRWHSPKQNNRIGSILVYSSLLLLAAVIAIYLNKNYWIVFVFIAALVDIYASFRQQS